MDQSGKVAVVTVSARGVGAAVALKLAGRGWKVVINYSRSEDQAREVEKACRRAGGETFLCRADVAPDADCRRMAADVMEQWGRIDALVNNAGTTKFCDHNDLEGLTGEDFQRIYGVNVIGPYQMIRAVAP
ncbi:MAG TPA: SDR family NAD(P)-dependent oxidoreductase, partial [Deltaproteobacteria bacterium]|nr:SDR family NAD(P)-dependent oxidoreductase [Deltaproteobacteria bacterium]